MKREGRQHGLVQTYPIFPLPWSSSSGESRRVNKLQSPPTAGLFTKVSQKPTNHSKFTGKCGRPKCNSCHINPSCKAKEKTKGTQKWRSRDVITNYRLVTWRAVDSRSGLKISGFSASEILDHLASDYYIDRENEIEEEEDDDDAYEEYNYGLTESDWIAESKSAITSRIVEIEEVDDEEVDEDSNAEKESDDDDKMSFCDVGIVWKHVDDEEGDETWCLVEDLQNCT